MYNIIFIIYMVGIWQLRADKMVITIFSAGQSREVATILWSSTSVIFSLFYIWSNHFYVTVHMCFYIVTNVINAKIFWRNDSWTYNILIYGAHHFCIPKNLNVRILNWMGTIYIIFKSSSQEWLYPYDCYLEFILTIRYLLCIIYYITR